MPLFLPDRMWDTLVRRNGTLYVHTRISNPRLGPGEGGVITDATDLTKMMPPSVVRPKRFLLGDFFEGEWAGGESGGRDDEEQRRFEVSSGRVERGVDVSHFKPTIMSKIGECVERVCVWGGVRLA